MTPAEDPLPALARQLLTMQDQLNCVINEKWREAGNAWYRAIWVECAEMMDHVGWKWWKHQTMDLGHAQLEVVDIFHFGISDMLQREASLDAAAARLSSSFANDNGVSPAAGPEEILQAIERFAGQTILVRQFDIASFWCLVRVIGLDFRELARRYIGKNVLNRFRQNHGYKTGGYQKLWAGREDNEWLNELVRTLDPTTTEFSTKLYDLLSQAYKGGAQG